jgi:hypothetical protein
VEEGNRRERSREMVAITSPDIATFEDKGR